MKAGVLVISNDNVVFDFIRPKLVLLRNSDSVYECSYDEALENISKLAPEIVIIYCGYDLHSFVELAKKITLPVIVCFDDIDTEYLLTACDCGISDFFTRKSTSEEILARVMLLLKNRNIKEKCEINFDILRENNLIDSCGFYNNPEKIFPYFLRRYDYGTFILLSSGMKDLKQELQRLLRDTDIKAAGYGNVYYIFLPNVDIDGAVAVVKKISALWTDVHAGICSHCGEKDFAQLNNVLENALNVAAASKKEYIIIDENLMPAGNWIEKIKTNKKNFKLFKQEFNKMLEQVLTPVFYQIQSKYEQKMYNTRFFHSITPEISIFKIMGEYFDSEFRLKSSGFSAVNIEIIHNTKEKRVTIDINNLEPKTIEVLLEEFIEEHKMYMEELC